MKKPRSSAPSFATTVADATASSGTATGDAASPSIGDTGDADAGSTAPPAQREPTAVDEIAARAGVTAKDVLVWRCHGDNRLVVVTIDGRKIVVDGDPEEVAR